MKEIIPIARRLKQWNPELKILLGGPEVGYRASESLQEYDWADGIFSGEAEESFPEWLVQYLKTKQLQDYGVEDMQKDGK